MPVAASRAPAAEASVRIAADRSGGGARAACATTCDGNFGPGGSAKRLGAAKSGSVNRKNVESENQFKTL